MNYVLSSAFLIIALMGTAAAGESLRTEQFLTCKEKARRTPEMRDCVGTEITTQDARLNRAYRKLGAQLTPARKKQLVAAQRLWIQYRDANCDFYLDPDGGIMAILNSGSCVIDATASRANELEGFME